MVLAIEADGASYRQSGSARDRDRLRGEHLQRLGWNFQRLWSPNWFHNPQAEMAKLRSAYARAVAATDPPPAPPHEPASAGEHPARERAAGERPAGQPAVREPAAGQPAAGQPAAGEPGAVEPVSGRPPPTSRDLDLVAPPSPVSKPGSR